MVNFTKIKDDLKFKKNMNKLKVELV